MRQLPALTSINKSRSAMTMEHSPTLIIHELVDALGDGLPRTDAFMIAGHRQFGDAKGDVQRCLGSTLRDNPLCACP